MSVNRSHKFSARNAGNPVASTFFMTVGVVNRRITARWTWAHICIVALNQHVLPSFVSLKYKKEIRKKQCMFSYELKSILTVCFGNIYTEYRQQKLEIKKSLINNYCLWNDRERGPGGGIICYYGNWLCPRVISHSEVLAMDKCGTEFFPVFFRNISFLLNG